MAVSSYQLMINVNVKSRLRTFINRTLTGNYAFLINVIFISM